MALSPPSDYTTDIANPFTDNWLFQFFYGALNTTNYTGVSFKDITVTDQNNNSKAFSGCITNKPRIRESVNPLGGMVKTSNITVDINDTSLFDDFFGGSNYYINKTVIVWSVSNDTTDLDNALRIYTGRLKTISHTDSKMTFSIQSHRPWDDITIPSNSSTASKVLEPVVYGEFTKNSANTYQTSKVLYPAPLVGTSGLKVFYSASRSLDGSSGNEGDAHFYQRIPDQFTIMEDDGNTTSVFDGLNCISVGDTFKRGTYYIRPASVHSSNNYTNASNVIDTDVATYGEMSHGGTASNNCMFDFPSIDGKLTEFKAHIKATVNLNESMGGNGTVKLRETSYAGSGTAFAGDIINITSTATVSTSGAGSGSAYSEIDMLSAYTDNGNSLPPDITLTFVSTGSGSFTTNCKIYDYYWVFTIENDNDNEPVASGSARSEVEKLYLGADGQVRSWDTGNVAEYGFNIHRDLLWRFAGVDATDYSAPTMNGSAWDDSAPSGFDDASEGKARVVILEPTPLVDVLDRLAYESCFMFRLGATENPQYISIKETESTDHTLTDDKITGLKVSHTPVSELKSKYVINSDPHPADDRFRTQATFTNSNRGNWIAITEENIYTEDLQYRLDNITEFHTYLDRLIGDVKLRVECKIVEPAIGVKVEVGDIVAFTNGSMVTKPFGTVWTSKQFVVVETNKSIGGQCAVKLWQI